MRRRNARVRSGVRLPVTAAPFDYVPLGEGDSEVAGTMAGLLEAGDAGLPDTAGEADALGSHCCSGFVVSPTFL